MAEKLMKPCKRKVAPKKAAQPRQTGGVILVGTYKEKQLAWIKRHKVYNYPITDKDELKPESCEKVKELWLYAGSKSKRSVFEAKFVDVKTKEEFLAENPSYAKLGKMHHAKYLVFKTEFLKYGQRLEDATVVARASDFAGRTKKIAAAVKEFQNGGDFALLADALPAELATLPRSQLLICDPAVQLDFFCALLQPRLIDNDECPHVPETRNIIDLFAGCGGLSLGFELAGFQSILAIEKDLWASETYRANRPNANVISEDITGIKSPKSRFNSLGEVFGIVGGPPCQGFSVSGGRDPKDPRNSLFMDYMRFVEAFKPSFFVMENVPGILSSVTKKGERVRDVIVSVASKIGYNVHQMLLDASNYGVPQARQRVFFVGIRNDYPFNPFMLTPVMTTDKSPISLWDAISDLPAIKACEGCETMSYGTDPTNEYQAWCRQNSASVHNHVAMRHTKRLVERFHVIQYGQSAADVPYEHMQRKRGDAQSVSGKIYSQNNMKPYPDRPSPTVPASFQSNFVHPYIDRNFTAREGARLQSFPDSYVFHGRRTTMSWEKNLSQYQQIGNAVPPLLARAIATAIKDYFSHIGNIKE